MPAQAPVYLGYATIKIDGQNLSDEAMNNVQELVIENTLHLPDLATFRIEDQQFALHTQTQFQIGKSVEISLGTEQNHLTPVFAGEIVGIDHDMAAHMVATFVVRCYDRSHRLHRGRERKSFQNVKDSDIVQQLAGNCGLQADVDATTEVHPYVFQNNQTNWEFISMLAKRNGYRMYTSIDRTIHFKQVSDDGEGEIALEYGADLTSFRPRMSSSGQVNKVTVKGWDPTQKQGIIGQATSPQGVPDIGYGMNGGAASNRAFGNAEMVIVDQVPWSQNGAELFAQSTLDEIAAGFVEADGLCAWKQGLKPNCKVRIGNIGGHFNGSYLVTSTTHHYSSAEGLTTQFSISGKKPPTLASAMGGGIQDRKPLGGNIVIGIVTNNQDPDGQARVRVKFPWLSDDDESYWARICTPMGGKNRGFLYIPEVDDEVLVGFEHGDITRAFILGGLWNGQDSPPENNNQAVTGDGVVHRIIQSRIGHKILIDDSGGKGEISFTTNGSHSITISDAENKIEVKTAAGHKMVLDQNGASITVQNPSGDKVEIQDSGTISVTANTSISLSAPSISISASATLSMSGSSSVTINGGTVNIN